MYTQRCCIVPHTTQPYVAYAAAATDIHQKMFATATSRPAINRTMPNFLLLERPSSTIIVPTTTVMRAKPFAIGPPRICCSVITSRCFLLSLAVLSLITTHQEERMLFGENFVYAFRAYDIHTNTSQRIQYGHNVSRRAVDGDRNTPRRRSKNCCNAACYFDWLLRALSARKEM